MGSLVNRRLTIVAAVAVTGCRRFERVPPMTG
jgi:hypothetical protein